MGETPRIADSKRIPANSIQRRHQIVHEIALRWLRHSIAFLLSTALVNISALAAMPLWSASLA